MFTRPSRHFTSKAARELSHDQTFYQFLNLKLSTTFRLESGTDTDRLTADRQTTGLQFARGSYMAAGGSRNNTGLTGSYC